MILVNMLCSISGRFCIRTLECTKDKFPTWSPHLENTFSQGRWKGAASAQLPLNSLGGSRALCRGQTGWIQGTLGVHMLQIQQALSTTFMSSKACQSSMTPSSTQTLPGSGYTSIKEATVSRHLPIPTPPAWEVEITVSFHRWKQ